MKNIFKIGIITFVLVFAVVALPAEAKPLSERVNEAFRHVFGRNPWPAENQYWLKRVVDGDKTTFISLVDAMAYHRSLGQTMPAASVPLSQRVNQAFRAAFGRNPTAAENRYWLIRVLNGDKTTYEALLGAMLYTKNTGRTIGDNPALSDDQPHNLKAVVRPLFFSIYGSIPNNTEKDWWRKRIDCEEILTHHGLSTSMRYHRSHNARIGSPNICRFILTPLPKEPESENGEDGTAPVETF